VFLVIEFHQLQELHHGFALAKLGFLFRRGRAEDPACHQEKQPCKQLKRLFHVGISVLYPHQVVGHVNEGAEGIGLIIVQLAEGAGFHAFVEHVGVAYAQAGQETLGDEHEGSLEVFAHLAGFHNLGRQGYEEGIFPEMDKAQVHRSRTASLVTENREEIFHPVGLPIHPEIGVLKNQDFVLVMLKPFCPEHVYVGHLEAFQPFLVQVLVLCHGQYAYFPRN